MTIQSVNPRSGEKFGPIFFETTSFELDEIVALSQISLQIWQTRSPSFRANCLQSVANALQENMEELVKISDLETGLGEVRLTGEIGRTVFQIREFANALQEGEFITPLVDSAVDLPVPQGHPQFIRTLTPIGVVAVFGASNFPFAFSVLGGDTSSALAAGCTVIVKAHPAHPQTSIRTYEIANKAMADAGAPKGTLAMVHGVDAGKMLLRDERVQAAAFTGSKNGGRALFDISNARKNPIPFYGELGSINPVIVLSSAITDPKAFASAYLDSLLLGNGQFCTNPSVMFIPRDSGISSEIELQIADRVPSPFLSQSTKELHDKNREDLRASITPKILIGQNTTEMGFYSSPMVFLSTVEHLLANESALRIECFGPTGLILTYTNISEVIDLVMKMDGALVASLFGTSEDADAPIAGIALARKVGRVAWNAWPTGVAVAAGQHHGGPYPASTAPLHTSVGLSAITRFLRPVTFQSLPPALLNQVALNLAKSYK